MSQTFVTVQWNRRKYVYDACVIGGIAAYLWLFPWVSRIALRGEQAIMTALDGTLDIKSTLGRGTVVTLGLPLYQK